MELFGSINTSVPGTNGYTVVPEAGYMRTRLGAENVAPIGDNLLIGTDYVISEIGGSSNEIYSVETNGSETRGSETRLEPVFVDKLPAPLEAGKVYISTLRGFNSALYFSPTYLNTEIKYKLACYASVLGVEMINLLLMPGKIGFSVFPAVNTKYSTLCDGKTIPRNGYPLYTQRVLATPGLADILVRPDDPVDEIRVPNYKDVMPLLYTGASDISAIIPGGTFNKSTIARAGFRGNVSVSTKRSGINNRRGYNTAGAPHQFNGGDGDATLGGTYTPDFNQFTAKNAAKVVAHDWFNAPPYCPLYPYIIIR